MRRLFILPVILLAFGVSIVRAQGAGETSSASFSISSIKSAFALAGTFDGEYSVRADAIEITISRAAVSLRDNCPYRGRRQLSFINVALASINSEGKQTIINRGRAIPVGETMMPGDKYVAERLRFSIPRDGSLDLSNCWLVVELGELTLDSTEEDKVGYAFARSDRDIFSSMLVKAAKK